MGLGVNLLNRGKGAEAYTVLEKALPIFQENHVDFMVSNTLIHLGNAALALNDLPGARAYLERAMQVAETVG